MAEPEQKNTTLPGEKTNKETLGKIKPSQIKSEEKEGPDDAQVAEKLTKEITGNDKSILGATRLLLREYGIRKSAAAVRDAVEMPHENFKPQDAVSALSSLGFKSSFGNIKLRKISKDFLPLIAFMNDGSAVLVRDLNENKDVSFQKPEKNSPLKSKPLTEFDKDFSGYVILAKELSKREKEERSGHWFFSSFKKSKWLYAQVMVAAMVSNFLSLSTALFTMTAYDRIIPNGAFESLVALSIGVVIALAFDFLIKSLRAKFIDIASKRADLEISRRLFDRILSLTPAEQRLKTGAMAGTIREFELLKEFFNSSTLVILIDLPFVFFFIYVIYLIAGPLAYVPMIAVPLVIIVGLGIQPFWRE